MDDVKSSFMSLTHIIKMSDIDVVHPLTVMPPNGVRMHKLLCFYACRRTVVSITHEHEHSHTCSYTRTHTHTNTRTHTHMYTRTHTHNHTQPHTHTHTTTHNHIHTHTTESRGP